MSQIVAEAATFILSDISVVFNEVLECYKHFYESD